MRVSRAIVVLGSAGWLAWAFLQNAADAAENELRVVQRDGHYLIEIVSDGGAAIRCPAEGLWSIAADWRDNRAADWRHAHAASLERVGPWTVVEGQLDFPG